MRRKVHFGTDVDLVVEKRVCQVLFCLGHFFALVLSLSRFVLLSGFESFQLMYLLENLRVQLHIELIIKVGRCDLFKSAEGLHVL